LSQGQQSTLGRPNDKQCVHVKFTPDFSPKSLPPHCHPARLPIGKNHDQVEIFKS